MQKFHFKVQGSAPTPYEIAATLHDNGIRISCTCKAGAIGQFCKHKMGILTGNPSGLIGGTLAELDLLKSTIASFEATQTIEAIDALNIEIEVLKKRTTELKKKLERITA